MIVGDIGQSILEEYLLIRLAQCTGNCSLTVDDYFWFVFLPASKDRNIGEKASKKK